MMQNASICRTYQCLNAVGLVNHHLFIYQSRINTGPQLGHGSCHSAGQFWVSQLWWWLTHSQEIIDHIFLHEDITHCPINNTSNKFWKISLFISCVEFSGWCNAKMAPENGKMQKCQIGQLIVETSVMLEISFHFSTLIVSNTIQQ